MIFRSLQAKIFLLVLVLILIPVLVLSLVAVSLSLNLNETSFLSYRTHSMRKIGSSIEYMFDEIDNASHFLIANEEAIDYLTDKGLDEQNVEFDPRYRSTLNTLTYLSTASNFIKAIQVVGENGRMMYTGGLSPNISQEDRTRAEELMGKAFWSADELPAGIGITNQIFYQCRMLRNPQKIENKVGIIKIYLDNNALERYFQNETDPDTDYFIMNEYGEIFFSTRQAEVDYPYIDYSELKDNHLGSIQIDADDESYVVIPYLLPQNNWVVYGVSNTRIIAQQVAASMITFGVLALFCVVLCILLAFVFSRAIFRPLMQVVDKMRSIENQDFSVRIETSSKDEIGILTQQFNRMAQRIQSLINEVYKVTIYKKEAELRALQEQINPHFLYNTLDSVYWTAKMEKATQTSILIKSMSAFFRLALQDTGEFSTVQNEIEHLKYYIALQQQTRSPFDCNVDVAPETYGCKVVRLALQPIVENAIVHGITGKEDGFVDIHIFKEEEKLIYTVEDNGEGMDVDEVTGLLASRGKRGFGIRNVNDRIWLAFGQDYGISFHEREGGGSLVRVTQPFMIWEPEKEKEEP